MTAASGSGRGLALVHRSFPAATPPHLWRTTADPHLWATWCEPRLTAAPSELDDAPGDVPPCIPCTIAYGNHVADRIDARRHAAREALRQDFAQTP